MNLFMTAGPLGPNIRKKFSDSNNNQSTVMIMMMMMKVKKKENNNIMMMMMKKFSFSGLMNHLRDDYIATL